MRHVDRATDAEGLKSIPPARVPVDDRLVNQHSVMSAAIVSLRNTRHTGSPTGLPPRPQQAGGIERQRRMPSQDLWQRDTRGQPEHEQPGSSTSGSGSSEERRHGSRAVVESPDPRLVAGRGHQFDDQTPTRRWTRPDQPPCAWSRVARSVDRDWLNVSGQALQRRVHRPNNTNWAYTDGYRAGRRPGPRPYFPLREPNVGGREAAITRRASEPHAAASTIVTHTGASVVAVTGRAITGRRSGCRRSGDGPDGAA
jgi:hypothetical protein